MNRWTVLLTTMLLCTFVVLGCSGGGDNPVTTSTGPGLTAGTPSHGGQAQTQLWGYWDVTIDVEAQTVEAVPNRTAMFGANVVTFLNGRPPGLAFFINDTPIGDGYIDVDIDVSLIHPLPGLPQYDGYDVRGIFIGDGSLTMDYESLLYAVNGPDQFLLNDDGYTRWWNPFEFGVPGVLGYTHGDLATPGYTGNATLNPYKYFADGLGAYDDYWEWLGNNTDTFGVFTSGSTNTRNYYLRFPDVKGVTYGYAVVANWEGEEIEDHPAPAPEAVGCSIVQDESQLYYVDETINGGLLILDVSVFCWDAQPSTILVESTVLSGTYTFDSMDMVPVSGDDYISTYHVEIPADNVTGLDDQEAWVICEAGAWDYTCEYTPPSPGAAPDATLAAYFRFPIAVSDQVPCTTPQVLDCTPGQGTIGGNVNIEVTTDPVLEDGDDLAVWLTMDGEPDIEGTNVTFVDSEHVTADISLAGVAEGLWDVWVMNGCDGIPGMGEDLFETVLTGGLFIEDEGDLPTPLPYPDEINFCVVGDDTNQEGVYYFGDNWQVLYYPLDYSADGQLYFTMQGNYGYGQNQFFGNPNELGALELDGTGGMIHCSRSANVFFGGYQTRQCVTWFAANNPQAQNGLTLNGLYGNVRVRDCEAEFESYSPLWNHWATYYDYNFGGNDVEIVMAGIGYPYGSGSYTTGWSINWGPLDETTEGSLDGEVSDIEQLRLAMDSDPVGLSGGLNVIFYYLEGDATSMNGSSDDPTVEVMGNNRYSLGSAAQSLATIDETNWVGTPIDIAVINSYGNFTSAESNWLVVLEDNGDSTWQICMFDQDGEFIERYGSAQDGDPLVMDVDTVNQKIHVWVDDGGTLRYFIFGYND